MNIIVNKLELIQITLHLCGIIILFQLILIYINIYPPPSTSPSFQRIVSLATIALERPPAPDGHGVDRADTTTQGAPRAVLRGPSLSDAERQQRS